MAIPLKYNFRNLVVRRVSTLMTVATIALVVAVFVALFALANGLNRSLIATGSAENVLIIRHGSQTEMQSGLSKEAFQIIQTLPGIARDQNDKPKASAEVAVVVNLPKRESGESSNVTLRGLSEMELNSPFEGRHQHREWITQRSERLTGVYREFGRHQAIRLLP